MLSWPARTIKNLSRDNARASGADVGRPLFELLFASPGSGSNVGSTGRRRREGWSVRRCLRGCSHYPGSVADVTLFEPWIPIFVVPNGLPEAGLVMIAELDSVDPFG